uniref:Uncharacterized protein n=1 Tax=Esox lucius TaxID=8010 RepID=A0AAY5L2N7_ESOLU
MDLNILDHRLRVTSICKNGLMNFTHPLIKKKFSRSNRCTRTGPYVSAFRWGRVPRWHLLFIESSKNKSPITPQKVARFVF